MSIGVMTALWKTCLYQGNALNVLLAMADWAEDDGGDIFPGIELLAAKARASVRTTQISLRALEADGVIERIANPRGGRGKVTEYKIDLERVQELQGFHEASTPRCEHCQAKRRSVEKRVQHRAQRVQASVRKGADIAQKGAESRERIDNTHQQPSNTHQHSPAPVGATEGEIATLGQGSSERWVEFRTAVTETWPGGFPASDEGKAKAVFERLTRAHEPAAIIIGAQLHGETMKARKDRRSAAAGEFLMKLPSNWLQDRGWVGYGTQAAEAAEREQRHALALARVREALTPGVYDLLQHQGMHAHAIAALDGMTRDDGPPPTLIASTSAQPVILQRYMGALGRHMGDGLRIIVRSRSQAG